MNDNGINTSETAPTLELLFYVGTLSFKNLTDLTTYVQLLYYTSVDELQDFCHKLVNSDNTLEEKFETWLIALGYVSELDHWKEKMKQIQKN